MEKHRGITITNVDKKKQCDIHVVINFFTNNWLPIIVGIIAISLFVFVFIGASLGL